MVTYTAQVNGAAPREIEVPTGNYALVVAMAVALADAELPSWVRIWASDVLPDYGPYTYLVHEDQCGNVVVSAR